MATANLPSSSSSSTTSCRHPLFTSSPLSKFLRPCLLPFPSRLPRHRRATPTLAFQRSDFDGFAKKVASGEALRDAWRSANGGFERVLYESRIAAQRLDRQYSISTRLADAARSAGERAREVDVELGIGRRWRSFSVDFARNLPRYRKELKDFLDTPLGRSFATIFFLWFALSGWMFRILVLATWILPFAAPLLLGTIAKNLVIQGSCPACKRQFVGARNQVIRCAGCGNIVWQPKDVYSRGQGGGGRSSTSEPDIIDIEIDDKGR